MNRLVWQRTCPRCLGACLVTVTYQSGEHGERLFDSDEECGECNGTGTITESADDVVAVLRDLHAKKVVNLKAVLRKLEEESHG